MIVQAAEGQANRVRQSSAAQQTQPLNISFNSIAEGLHAGTYQSSEVIKQDVQEICHMAADLFCNTEQASHSMTLTLRRGCGLYAAALSTFQQSACK